MSRKLAQPLVPQKRRPDVFAAWVRRRIRRMAEARPVTDDVAVRVIIVWVRVLSGAPSSRYERSAARPGFRSVDTTNRSDGCGVGPRGPGAGVGRSDRFVAADWMPISMVDNRDSVNEGPCAPAPAADDSGLFTERWLILGAGTRHTRRGPGRAHNAHPRHGAPQTAPFPVRFEEVILCRSVETFDRGG